MYNSFAQANFVCMCNDIDHWHLSTKLSFVYTGYPSSILTCVFITMQPSINCRQHRSHCWCLVPANCITFTACQKYLGFSLTVPVHCFCFAFSMPVCHSCNFSGCQHLVIVLCQHRIGRLVKNVPYFMVLKLGGSKGRIRLLKVILKFSTKYLYMYFFVYFLHVVNVRWCDDANLVCYTSDFVWLGTGLWYSCARVYSVL